MTKKADRWGNTFTADVVYEGQTLGMISYTGTTRGDLIVQTERKENLLIAKLVGPSGFVHKRVQFHLQASRQVR